MYERRAVSRRRFETIVRRSLRHLPPELAARLENVDIVVRMRPSSSHLRSGRVPPGHTLLGLYVGTDLTRRDSGYNFALPDRILIFQEPLEQLARDEQDLIDKVRHTVLHEVAHHFGISDDRLRELEAY
ncbi:MAG: metallopeptidase family protein [Dehalococcoidia bacterium]